MVRRFSKVESQQDHTLAQFTVGVIIQSINLLLLKIIKKSFLYQKNSVSLYKQLNNKNYGKQRFNQVKCYQRKIRLR